MSAYSSQDSTYETYPMPVVRPETVHFGECWEHNDVSSTVRMMAAHRELLAGTAVCADPEHVADAVAERLAEWEQEAEIEWARTVSHDGWHAVKGYAPCVNCTAAEHLALVTVADMIAKHGADVLRAIADLTTSALVRAAIRAHGVVSN